MLLVAHLEKRCRAPETKDGAPRNVEVPHNHNDSRLRCSVGVHFSVDVAGKKDRIDRALVSGLVGVLGQQKYCQTNLIWLFATIRLLSTSQHGPTS